MSIIKVSVLPRFWRDWKDIRKKHKGRDFDSLSSPAEFDDLDDDSKMDTIPHLRSIKNTVINSIQDSLIDHHAPQYDRQPFLTSGWIIRKMRWAIDNKGKSHGLRLIFCVNEGHVFFCFVATKNKCADERDLEVEFIRRIREYLSI